MVDADKVMILGVTGAIGRGLPPMLAERGMEVTGVSRGDDPRVAGVSRWQKPDALDPGGHVAVINLAGESIAKRWTKANRQRFHDSRVGLTGQLVEAIRATSVAERPSVLINGSAVGYYGDRGDDLLTESCRAGEDDLARLCVEWEEAAERAVELGLRVVTLRTGVVLGRGTDAWDKLAGVLRTGLGGKLGHGRQWMPWIHLEDIRRAIVHAVVSDSLSGPLNGVAPEPERNAELSRKVAAAFHRPAVLPVPGFALRLAVGGFASALLASQRAVPEALQADGFEFQYPTLELALEELVGE